VTQIAPAKRTEDAVSIHCTGEKRRILIQKLLKHPNIFVFFFIMPMAFSLSFFVLSTAQFGPIAWIASAFVLAATRLGVSLLI